MFEILAISALIGVIPGYIAHSKGRSFFLWWLYGVAFFIIALIHALLISPNVAEVEQRQLDNGMKKCPHCAELIKADANICRYCGRDQHSETADATPA
ncbi:zinc ribbon domain-containing protein [Nitrospirillum sp. BR 11752]|uniref:zinc ribbon domain-containing protein n=1 Tax=Nitrospirillum sp. BR 11752 TaxID=3104293 RepID=UPI002EAC164E|nr:zinc ribbon domain-containing protein [Nitrospirillum sp. BR 11752]